MTSRVLLDTSSLLECWSRYYPLDVFPGIWERLSYLIEGGDVIAPDEVHDEIKHKDDGLAERLKQRTSMFVALEGPVQVATREVLAEFPELVKALGSRNQADPFVIGLARVREATVVTQERGGSREAAEDSARLRALRGYRASTWSASSASAAGRSLDRVAWPARKG
jgi:hypothetical protein